MSESIPAAIEGAVATHAGTTVILHSDSRYQETTLSELWEESLRVAASLRSWGIGPGDVVLIQLPNWRECFVLHVAVWLCGGVVLPVVPVYGVREIMFIAGQSSAKVYVGTDSWRTRDNKPIFDALAALPALEHRIILGNSTWEGGRSFDELSNGDPAGFTAHHADGSDLALLVYTSGTTADPKGVQHTHATLLAEVRSLLSLRGGGPEVTSLAAFPSGHIAGVLGILRLFTRGTLTIAMEAWDPTAAARLIAKHRVQASGGAPIYLSGILDVADAEGLDLSSLREYTLGAANVSPELIRRAESYGICAFRCYGSSEHPTISSGCADDPLEKRASTDGRIAPGSEIRLVDDDGHDVEVGEDGEILTRGPELFIGYADRTLDESSFVDGGWFRTGDIGRLDADGYLTITDRKKDIIVRGGENISSKEVEDILLTHPAVAQVAAVGAPDERYGERVCAFMVLRPSQQLDLTDIREFFERHGVSKQKTPERLEVVADLPRTASGKVQKRALRALLA